MAIHAYLGSTLITLCVVNAVTIDHMCMVNVDTTGGVCMVNVNTVDNEVK